MHFFANKLPFQRRINANVFSKSALRRPVAAEKWGWGDMDRRNLLPPGPGGMLTAAEQRLIECARTGATWGPQVPDDFPWDAEDFSNNLPANAETWPDTCKVRPEVIRCLITGARWSPETEPWHLHSKGVLIANALIDGDLDLEGCELLSQLWLFFCRVRGRIMLQDAVSKSLGFDGTYIVRGPDPQPKTFPHAISARRLCVTGDVFLRRGFYADREVLLKNAHIGGSLDCEGGIFHTPGWIALNCAEIEVGNNVYLNHDYRAEGRTDFSRARIGGSMHCNGGAFDSEAMGSLLLTSAHIGENLRLRKLKKMRGSLSLAQADVRIYSDDGTARPKPGSIVLDGFTYQRIRISKITAGKCLKWLRCQPKEDLKRDFKPQPWIHLIRVLRNLGHEDVARKIAVKRENAMSQLRRVYPQQWLWHRLLHYTIGYGYRPHWALIWSAALVVIGWLVFQNAYRLHYISPRDGSVIVYMTANKKIEKPPLYNKFNAAVYALDVYMPVIQLGQDQAWETSFPPRDTSAISVFRKECAAYLKRVRNSIWGKPFDYRAVASAAVGTGLWEFLFSNGFHRLVYWCEEFLGWVLVSLYIVGMSGILKKEWT